jgi:glycine cleavage system aminomethyltransferase T
MTFSISIGCNIRKSPYFDATVADGVRSFSVYNHMYIPGHFGDPAGEYRRLIEGVAMWDVGAQRQVEISGPDAATLVRYLCARDLTATRVGQGRYVPICNHDGILINDPVLLKLSDQKFWLSIADSDIELWAGAIARERGLDVRVFEPDASPLAVQGPKAEDVIATLFGGDWPRELRYFGFRECELDGIPLVLARSGWSKQGGFELYLRDGARGGELWERVKRAGAEYGIGPGAPNDIERIESGLLSYGADARLQTCPANPFELGLGKLVDLDRGDDFVGKRALLEIRAEGIRRRFSGFVIDGDPVPGSQHPLPLLHGDRAAGSISEMAWSPRLGKNVSLGLVNNDIDDNVQGLTVDIGDSVRGVTLATLPFVA